MPCEYCIRCHQAGFRIMYALDSYLLHFMGKSSWRGGEKPAERQAREQKYFEAFRNKWGTPLANLMIAGRIDGLSSNESLLEAWNQAKFQKAVGQLLQIESNG
jgi:GT2 family glycosyltransferase